MSIASLQAARRMRLIGWLVLLAIGILLLRSGGLVQRVRTNVAYFRLNRALATRDMAGADRAVNSFEHNSSIPGESRRSWRGIALARMSQSRFNEATSAWRQVDDADKELRSWAERAEKAGDFAAARDWYQVALELQPNNGDLWYRLGRVSSILGDSQATDYYLQALAAAQRVEYGRSNILTRLGELAKRERPPDWTAVLARFEDALRQDDFADTNDVILAHLGRAEALERLGQPRVALDAYRALAQLRPGHYWANVHSGRLTWQEEEDANRAIDFLNRAIAIDPKPKWAYRYLGLVYAQTGRADLAIPLFQKVLTIDPDDTMTRTQLERLESNDES